ncbi:MAG: hypothetical protein KAH00_02840 [Cocleimonas sp.]|nr:hypothetical protein [Cocleimonas sp.]
MRKKNNKSEHLWTIVAVLGFTLLLLIGYKLKASLTPNITTTTPLDKSCDLRQGKCTTLLPTGGKISLSITPNTLPILHPLELTVTIDSIDASKIEVDFIGIGMDMGYNRSTLDKVDAKNFKGKAVIPVCIRSKMEWEARVILYTDHGLIMAPFRFFTIK